MATCVASPGRGSIRLSVAPEEPSSYYYLKLFEIIKDYLVSFKIIQNYPKLSRII